jgi:hypothetical protein
MERETKQEWQQVDATDNLQATSAGDFDGVAKEDPAYEQTVEDFVDELIADPVGK